MNDGRGARLRRWVASRRMPWPNAVALIAVASLLAWLVIAQLFVGVSGDGGIASDPERDDLQDFAPATGPDDGPALP